MRLLSPNAATILSSFLDSPSTPRYGYELMQETGIKSGSLYPVLGRFERQGWIVGSMEESIDNRPPRKVYRFDIGSRAEAEGALDRFFDVKGIQRADRPGWGLA